MKYIFHISDIHIDVERVNNLQNSFDRLVKDIVLKGVDDSLLVIVGDIFENKTILTQAEIGIFDEMMNLLNVSNIRTFIVVGNHDFNINLDAQVRNNKMVLDILTQSYNNITCLTYTQVYNVPNTNIEFHLYSIVDGKIPEYTKNQNIKIALLHDAVNNAKYDNGVKITGSRFNINDFDNYDYTMLGDIHKPQFLTDTMAYCGSFIQKNKGEGVNHGYILWDLENNENTDFVFIPLIDIMIKIEARDNKTRKMPDLLEFQKVKYVQLVYDTKCTTECLEKIKKKMIQKYGMINKIVPIDKTFYSRLSNTKKTVEFVENLGEFKQVNHEQCIREILKGKTNDEISKVIEYHNNQLSHMTDANHSNYKINYMSWSNILCYGENNYLDFRDFNNSIVILNGKNKYGKSSIIDILIRILFNECERGYKKDIVNKNKQSGSIKISISVQSGTVATEQGPTIIFDEYRIEQVLVKTEGHTIHKLYKNGEDITKDSIPATYKYLKEDVGIGCYKDFINMTTALQNRKFLVDMKEEEFLDILIKLLNIELLDSINKTAKAKQTLLAHDIKKYNAELTNINKTLESFNDNSITKDNSEKLNPSQDIQKDVCELEEKIKTEKISIKTMNNELQELNKSFDNSIDTKLMTDVEINNIGETLAKMKRQIKTSLTGVDIHSVLENIKKYESIINKYKTEYAIELNKLAISNYDCKQPIEEVTDPEISDDAYHELINKCDCIKIDLVKPSIEFKDEDKFNEACENLSNILKKESKESYKNKLENLRTKIRHVPDGEYSNTTVVEIDNKINKLTTDFKSTYGKDIAEFENADLVKCSPNISEKKYTELAESIKDRIIVQDNFLDFKQKISESIDDEILSLEKSVYPKKELLSEALNIEKELLQEFEQNETGYRKLVTDGLPDFNLLEGEKKIVDAKIKTYNMNYGSIQINQDCTCCISNKKILDKFNIDAETTRLAEINTIVNAKTDTILRYNKFKNVVSQVDTYRANVILNKDIMSNNLQFDKLAKLKLTKQHLNNLQLVRDYEKLLHHNCMVDAVSTIRRFQSDKTHLLNCLQLSLLNEKINSEIHSIKTTLKNISDFETLISTFNLTKKYFSDLTLLKTFQNKILHYEKFQKFQIKKKVKIIFDKISIYKNKFESEKDFEKYFRLEQLLKNIITNKEIAEKINLIRLNIDKAELVL